MLYRFFVFCLFLSAITVTGGFAGERNQPKNDSNVVTMCVDPDWEPFEIINKQGRHEGIAADLVRLVAERSGVTIKLIPTTSWEESLELSKSKKCDILSFVNQTPERSKWLIFTDPLFTDPNVLITREEHPQITDLGLLKNETIAIPSGTAMMERFHSDFPNLKIIPVTTESEAMKLVSERKADMTVRSLIIAAYTIKKEGLFNLKIAGTPKRYENYLRIAVLDDKPELRERLNEGLHTITDEERDAIVNRHVSIVVNESADLKIVRLVGFGIAVSFVLLLLILLWNRTLQRNVKSEVTKNLRIREQLYQNSKQAELGNMIGSISHQWREPLSKLSSINLLLIARIKAGQTLDNEWLLEQAQKTEETIDFMSHTMQHFLEFYKRSDKQENFSIIESIYAVLSIIETKMLDLKIDIMVKGDSEKELSGVKNEWMHVWLNIINNSIKVFEDRRITFPIIRIVLTETDICFYDNAGGIEMEKEHNGLGLQMCREICEKNGLKFEYYNYDAGLCSKIILRCDCDMNT